MKSIKHAILSAAIAAAIGVPAISFAATKNSSAPTTQMSATMHKDKTADQAAKKTKKKKNAKTAAAKANGGALKSPVNAAPKG